jgi:hypothetical protein
MWLRQSGLDDLCFASILPREEAALAFGGLEFDGDAALVARLSPADDLAELESVMSGHNRQTARASRASQARFGT